MSGGYKRLNYLLKHVESVFLNKESCKWLWCDGGFGPTLGSEGGGGGGGGSTQWGALCKESPSRVSWLVPSLPRLAQLTAPHQALRS